MEYRKIIEFGKSSYVVSLPKEWLKMNKLKKGDVLYLDKEDDKINLYAPNKYSTPTPKKATLDITGLDPVQIKMLLLSRYIKNYNEITIIGKDLPEKSEKVRAIIHDLIALEVMEANSEKIVTKDFINMNDIDVLDMIKKMDVITREMMTDSLDSFDNDIATSLKIRDKDVNRLNYLVSRSIRYLQRRPALAKEKGYTQGELMRLWNLSVHIESVADNVKRVSTMMRRVKISNGARKQLLSLLREVHQYYYDAVDAYINREQSKAAELRPRFNVLTKKCKDYFRSNWDIDWVPTILEKLKVMVAGGKAITTTLCDQS